MLAPAIQGFATMGQSAKVDSVFEEDEDTVDAFVAAVFWDCRREEEHPIAELLKDERLFEQQLKSFKESTC